jgi:hypothetical protein
MRALTVVLAVSALAATLGATAGAQGGGVSIAARPAVAPSFGPITLFGAVGSGQGGEPVTIEIKDCGLPQVGYRGVIELDTEPGGRWQTEYYPGITTSIRAAWKNTTSPAIDVKQAARVLIRRVPSTRKTFEISISGKLGFWGRKALFQQRVGSSWKTIKTVRLTEQGGVGNAGIIWTSVRFKATVPRGKQVRGLLPAASAKPCYLSGASNPMRT